MLHTRDNVATALFDLEQGEKVSVLKEDTEIQVELKDGINFGHKFSLDFITAGEEVVKYGEPIGVACKNIAPGEHVHIQNVESQRGRGDKQR